MKLLPVSTTNPRLNIRRVLLLAGAGALAALAIGCTPTTQVTVAGDAQTSQGIAVTGRGEALVSPDLAILNLGVEVNAESVAEARSAAADAMEAIQESITSQGVEERDIQTQYFNIYPQYSYPPNGGTPTIVGFTVQNVVQVKVRNLDTVSDVLDGAIEAGGDAVRVNGIQFTVEDPESALGDARRDAVADARAHAEVLADAAGVTLGDPISINESTSGQYPPPYGPEFARAQDGAGGSTPVNPGEQQLTIHVSVVFSIAE